jgi:hypothetical protein
MPRHWLALLAVLLLLGSAQAVAGGDRRDRDDERDEDQDEGKDAKPGKPGKRDRDRDRDRDREREDRRGGGDDDGDEPDGNGDGGKRKDRRIAAPDVPGVQVLPRSLPQRAEFTFLVTPSTGLDEAVLEARLPDVGGPWRLAGPGASACELDGRDLACAFDGLDDGGLPLVKATARVGTAPAWESVAEATLRSADGSVLGAAAPPARIGVWAA